MGSDFARADDPAHELTPAVSGVGRDLLEQKPGCRVESFGARRVQRHRDKARSRVLALRIMVPCERTYFNFSMRPYARGRDRQCHLY